MLDRVLAIGDEWMPGHQRDLAALAARIDELRDRAAACGRRPVPVTIFAANPARLARYAEMGVHRCVFLLPTSDAQDAVTALGRLASACDRG